MDELIVGQDVRFQQGSKISNAYKIACINNSGSFEIEGSLHPDDLEMLSSPAELQIVPVYRAGSRIPIHLKPGILDSDFGSTSFYMDGVEIARIADGHSPRFCSRLRRELYFIGGCPECIQNQTLIRRESAFPAVGLAPDGTKILPTVGSIIGNNQIMRKGPSVTIGSEIMMVAGFDDLDAEELIEWNFIITANLN